MAIEFRKTDDDTKHVSSCLIINKVFASKRCPALAVLFAMPGLVLGSPETEKGIRINIHMDQVEEKLQQFYSPQIIGLIEKICNNCRRNRGK